MAHCVFCNDHHNLKDTEHYRKVYLFYVAMSVFVFSLLVMNCKYLHWSVRPDNALGGTVIFILISFSKDVIFVCDLSVETLNN